MYLPEPLRAAVPTAQAEARRSHGVGAPPASQGVAFPEVYSHRRRLPLQAADPSPAHAHSLA